MQIITTIRRFAIVSSTGRLVIRHHRLAVILISAISNLHKEGVVLAVHLNVGRVVEVVQVVGVRRHAAREHPFYAPSLILPFFFLMLESSFTKNFVF